LVDPTRMDLRINERKNRPVSLLRGKQFVLWNQKYMENSWMNEKLIFLEEIPCRLYFVYL